MDATRETSDTIRRFAAVAVAALLTGGALSGCTGGDGVAGDGAGGTPSPTAATPTTTPSASATGAADDEARLPLPVDEIAGWAATAVPSSDAPGFTNAYSGWLSEHTSPRTTSDYLSLPAGHYVVTVACRGEGTITSSFQSLEGEPLDAADRDCMHSTTTFDVTSTETGMRTVLTLDGAPTIYAVSFQNAEGLAP